MPTNISRGDCDQHAEGKRICAEFIQELATIDGIAAAHVMAPAHPSAIPEVIEAAKAEAGKVG